MDDSLESMILRGCNLATILEQNLPILANQPDFLVKSCEEIVSVFSNVKERVLYVGQMGVQELHGFDIGGGTREHAMASLDARAAIPVGESSHGKTVGDMPESSEVKGMFLHDEKRRQLGLELMFGEMIGGVGGDITGGSTGGIGVETPLDVSAATSSQRQGRR